LKGDRALVAMAVEDRGVVLQHASDALKNDPSIVLTATLEDARALQFASAEVRCSRLFAMEVIEKKWEALQYLSADLQADREAELPRCEVRLGRTAKRPQPLSGSPRSARGQIRVKGPVDASAAGIVLEFPGGAEEQKK
jgi:hypothetical protein